MRTVIRVLVNAFALWLTTLIVGGSGDHGVWIAPINNDNYGHLLTLVLVAMIFGLVNGTLGRVVRFVSIPLYVLTLGLIGLIINGIMLAIVAWLSDLAGFGLRLEGFWWGVLAALVLSILSGLLNGLLGTSKKRDRRTA
ncbi:phage holin family protein [Leucobacter sp. NPDC058333]|uniref:phage holin family protein n=1 Tax=Leucobacter sp. NPDC058333 TaxID=3346450 RepID=UPI0036649EA0